MEAKWPSARVRSAKLVPNWAQVADVVKVFLLSMPRGTAIWARLSVLAPRSHLSFWDTQTRSPLLKSSEGPDLSHPSRAEGGSKSGSDWSPVMMLLTFKRQILAFGLYSQCFFSMLSSDTNVQTILDLRSRTWIRGHPGHYPTE